MCLKKLDENSRPDPQARGYGWKVVRRGRLGQYYTPLQGSEPLEPGVEYQAQGLMGLCDDSTASKPIPRYRLGFHLFENRADAETFATNWFGGVSLYTLIVRVAWRGLFARGPQAMDPQYRLGGPVATCTVAEYITILEGEPCPKE